MKRILRRGLLALICLAAASSATAQPASIEFVFNFTDATSGAQANGCIILAGEAIVVPFGASYSVPSEEVLDLSVTITGATSGNGTFGTDDIASIAWDSNGGALNLTQQLVGQSTDVDPWGTPSSGDGGDFNLFGTGSPAPEGVFYFTLAADNGDEEAMLLTSMIEGDSEACSVFASARSVPSLSPLGMMFLLLALSGMAYLVLRRIA